MKQPHEWARLLKGPARWVYSAAAQLYGWDAHRHHYASQPLLLSEVDFTEAIDRASRFPASELLPAALSPCSLLRGK